jgi:hypothetical protein
VIQITSGSGFPAGQAKAQLRQAMQAKLMTGVIKITLRVLRDLADPSHRQYGI